MDCKIADVLLKKSIKQHVDGWDSPTQTWVHMVLHLTYPEGGFDVTFNDVTKDVSFYTTTSRFVFCLGDFSQERQDLWLSKDDLQDPSSWSSSPLLLRDIHSKFLTDHGCKEGCAPSQSQTHGGVSGRLISQDGDDNSHFHFHPLDPHMSYPDITLVPTTDDSSVSGVELPTDDCRQPVGISDKNSFQV